MRVTSLLLTALWWTVVGASRYRHLYEEDEPEKERTDVANSKYVYRSQPLNPSCESPLGNFLTPYLP